tara:strand:+ start:240 stop:803 length:564 start_codon:yes stop_codon:yes gene_type:complete
MFKIIFNILDISMNLTEITKFFILITIAFSLSNCGIYKPVDARKVPVNDEERVKKNIAEGKGISLGKVFDGGGGGTFQFSSSNEMWRATLEILDFIPLSDVDYGGGIIISDWYASPNKENESIKIMVRFLSNEIRADGIKVNVYKKQCATESNCQSILSNSELNGEIKLAILKKAALIKKADLDKKN